MTVDLKTLSSGTAELYRNDWKTRMFYPMGDWLFKAPSRMQAFTSRKVEGNILKNSLLGKTIMNPVWKTLNWFTKQFLDYDYRNYIKVGSLQLSRPSPGAFAMMLFPFTIAPRLVQALKRSEDGDRSEFYDILRRDIPTIAALLYLLDPVQALFTRQMQKAAGVRLVNQHIENVAGKKVVKGVEIIPAGHATLNLSIDSKRALLEILKDSANKPRAMRHALNTVTDQWLSIAGGEVADDIHKLKSTLEDLFKAHEAHAKAVAEKLDDQAIQRHAARAEQLSERGYQLIERLEGWKTNKMKDYLAEGAKAVKKRFPSMKEFFVRYAHTRRLPVDIISFIVVCFGIGWLPVWFNDMWSKKQHAAKKNGANNANANPFDAALTYEALRNSSRISGGFQQFQY